MPKKYQAMRDKFMEEGMGKDKAQTKAAKIYNAQKKPGDPAANANETGYPETDEKGYPKAGHEMKMPTTGMGRGGNSTRKRKGSGGAMKATVNPTSYGE